MTATAKHRSAQKDVMLHFETAAARLGLDAGTCLMLREPWRDLEGIAAGADGRRAH